VQALLPAGATQERTLTCCAKSSATSWRMRRRRSRRCYRGRVLVRGQRSERGAGLIRCATTRIGRANNSVRAVAQRAMDPFSKLRDAIVFAFAPSAVLETRRANGFGHVSAGSRGRRPRRADRRTQSTARLAAKEPSLTAVRPNARRPPAIQRQRRHNARRRTRAVGRGHQRHAVCGMGQPVCQRLHRQGRVKKVYLQADAPFRMVPEDLNKCTCVIPRANGAVFDVSGERQMDYGSPRLERLQRHAVGGDPRLRSAGPQLRERCDHGRLARKCLEASRCVTGCRSRSGCRGAGTAALCAFGVGGVPLPFGVV